MDVILETIMFVCFCLAMCILIYRFAKDKATYLKAERAIAWTMGVGFALGVVKELFFPPVRWMLALYVLGAILAYSAVLFSYSELCKPETENTQKETPLDQEEA